MEHDLEVAGALGASGAETPLSHPVASGLPCANCGAVVEARYCTSCGQLASDFHRPIWELLGHTLSDSFSLDGRLWRTLPALMVRPGRVTRNYLDGQRARYVPPFRLFLLSSLLFFLFIFTVSDRSGWFEQWRFTPDDQGGITFGGIEIGDTSEEELADLKAAAEDEDAPPAARQAAQEAYDRMRSNQAIVSALAGATSEDGRIDRAALFETIRENVREGMSPEEEVQLRSAIDQTVQTYENRDLIGARMRAWAPRFSVLFLPIFALFLILLYAWRRRVYVYDHLVTALHFQTWLYLFGIVLFGIGLIVPSIIGTLVFVGLFAPLAYLYRMIRVTYGSGHITSALRAFVLFFLSTITVSALAVSLVAASVMWA